MIEFGQEKILDKFLEGEALNRKSERIPRRFCLTAVVLPIGSASAAQAAGVVSESENGILPYGRCVALPQGRTFPAACCGELQ